MPGPAVGATCTVCNHPAIVLINKAINDGMSDRKVAGAFGFKYHGVIQRHRSKGHPGVKTTEPQDRPEPAAYPEDGSPRDQLQWLVDQLRSQAEEGDVRADLARELRLSLEAQAKMGTGEPPAQVQVRDVDGLAEAFREMHEALKPWPEAREAMAAVWRSRRALAEAVETPDTTGEEQSGDS